MDKSILRVIAERNLSSIMNNTKWKKFVTAITRNEGYDPLVQIKYIHGNQPHKGFSAVWWNEVEQEGFELIEWIKINPVKEKYIGRLVEPTTSDYTDFVRQSLDEMNIPYEVQDNLFVVYGYK